MGLVLALAVSAAGGAAGAALAFDAKPIPAISESFVVHTTEVDDTQGGTVSVRQTLAIDLTGRRSHMTADGEMTQGHLEQIRRCDFKPMGYGIQINGAPGSKQSSWTCTNVTMPSDPDECQFSNFWDTPDNASWTGATTLNGTACDRWVYWMMGDKYEFLVAGTTPLRIGKIFTAVPGFHLWHIDFTGFVAYPGGHVPLSLFSVEPGVKCKPAAAIADVSADQLVAVVPLAPVALRRASLTTLPLPDAAANANANAAAATAAAAAAGSGADPCVATGERVTVNGTEYLTKFEVVTPGHAPAISRPNTAVAAQVTGTLLNGTVFWKSVGDFDYVFDASPRQLIVGFDVGSFGMMVGETRKLCIPPSEGYGAQARGPIPANSTLIFTLVCDKLGP